MSSQGRAAGHGPSSGGRSDHGDRCHTRPLGHQLQRRLLGPLASVAIEPESPSAGRAWRPTRRKADPVLIAVDNGSLVLYAYAMHEFLANKLGALGAMIEERTNRALNDLSPSAAAVLSTLYFRPGLTTTELSKVVAVSQPTAVRLLDGLQRRGLVERGPQAGRFTPLTLTDAGRIELIRLQRDRIAAIGALLTILEPDDMRRFELALDRVLAGATTSRACARTTCRLCEHDLCGPGICPIGNKATAIEQEGHGI